MLMALHIPDGFLSPVVSLVGLALAALALILAWVRTRGSLGERQVPMLGLLAAFIFAAQAINFPVAAGTSGHLLGGALAAIVLGPWAACWVMALVILVQCLLFQDGGLLALGWNLLNMGVFTALSGYLTYRVVTRLVAGRVGRLTGAFLAGWVSVQMGALATCLELAASGTTSLALALPAMGAIHALIGIGEALITMGAVSVLDRVRPDLLQPESAPRPLGLALGGSLLAVCLLVAALSPWASASPDGLEAVAERQGFLDRAVAPVLSVFPDYTLGFVRNPVLATMGAVGLGTLVMFATGYLLARMLGRERRAAL